jgi:aryl-alcohol dehydrogenase-like predicted oxidoreductase
MSTASTLKSRRLGDKSIHPIGLGCMNFTHGYSQPPSKHDAIDAMARAVDLGVEHFDLAALYGAGKSEELAGEALKAHRSKIFLATKGGLVVVDGKRVIDGRPDSIRQHCEASLQRLQTDVIDLYYLHRWDRSVPIEDSVGAMKELVVQGKIRHLGLSEVSAPTLRRAHAVHPIAALQTEYSLWTREPEIAALRACEELGVAFVAFSPVARGFLTSAPPALAELDAKDLRQNMPRFSGENYVSNLKLLATFTQLAQQLNATPAQLAMAWLLHTSPCIHAIPGSRNALHIQENQASNLFALSPELIATLNQLMNQKTVQGARYTASAQADVDTEQF